MTAKEKAEELFKKYVPLVPETHWMDRAKQCAIIAVDEMLYACAVIDGITQPYTETDEPTWTNFWQQVKQEINSL